MIVNVVKIVKSVVPNKKAKERKQERRKKNEHFQKHGRTPSQIARKKKRK